MSVGHTLKVIQHGLENSKMAYPDKHLILLILQGLKKLEFQLVLWASSSHILLVQGHFLLVLVNDLLEDDLPGPLPTGQNSLKSYLPRKKIYLSQTTRQDFFLGGSIVITGTFNCDKISLCYPMPKFNIYCYLQIAQSCALAAPRGPQHPAFALA